jgi:hypothetical protein
VLTLDYECAKTRLFRSHEKVELVGAIADTRAMLGREGVGVMAAERDGINGIMVGQR